MTQDPDIRLLTSPRIFLVGMAAFLALVGFVVLILYQQIALAFSANPGLNGLILGVLAIGALFTFRQVIRLFREIHWVNSLTGAVTDGAPAAPILLAPMAVMLNAGAGARGLSTITTRERGAGISPTGSGSKSGQRTASSGKSARQRWPDLRHRRAASPTSRS